MAEAVAHRYAEALYLAAGQNAALLERIGFELEKFIEATRKYPDLVVYFDSPLVEEERKYEFIGSLAREMEISDEVHGLLRSAIKRGRFFYLGPILKAFKELLDVERASDEVLIVTPRALTEQEETLIKKRLETVSGKRLTARQQVDPRIISGIRAEIGHTIYDSSLSYSLNLLKERMVNQGS